MTQPVNPWEDSVEEREASGSKPDSRKAERLSCKEGKTRVRIVGAYYFFKDHWFNKVKRSAVCPGKECPVCSHPDKDKWFAKARALRDAGKEKEAKELFKQVYNTFGPGLSYVVNVIDKTDSKIKIWTFSKTIKDRIKSLADDFGDPTSFDLVITRTGQKLATKYVVDAARDTEPLTEEEKKLQPYVLRTIFKTTSVDKINSYLKGIIPAKPVRTEPETPVTPLADNPAPSLEEPDLSTMADDEELGF